MLLNHWYVGCIGSELQTRPIGKIICSQPMVMYRRADGSVAALRNVCPHRQAPLSMGDVDGDVLRCKYHGMAFDGGGRCTHIPSQDVIPPKAHIRAYPVIERYGFVWVWPGDPELARDDLLPSLPWREDAAWDGSVIQYFHVKAPHALMSDNLLDLSHVAFLHAGSIGFDPSRLGNDPLEVVVGPAAIRTSRVFKNTVQAPAHKAWRALEGPIDRVQVADWRPPGNVSVLVRNDNGVEQVDLRADHLITPETEGSHHYYIAMTRNFRLGDAQFSQQLDADARGVHQEDVDMAQAQHEMRQWNPGGLDMPLKADKAVSASHRILAQLAAAEVTPAG